MLVEVLQIDIDGAECGSEEFCPVARAIRRTVGLGWSVYVSTDCVWIGPLGGDESEEKEIELPEMVGEIIIRYDTTTEMFPFGFRL